MKPFIHTPTHLKSHRILPGHGRAVRGTTYAIPGVDRSERQARRSNWTETQAQRRRTYGLGGSIGLVGAMLALMITLLAAMGPNTNVLDRSVPVPSVELVDTADPDTPPPATRASA